MAACALAIAGSAAHAQGLSGGLQAAEYNGYHISCEGASDGSINLTITSGQAPFTYSWSNQATTEDISQVPAGYYRVTITDAAQDRLTLDITLLQPEKLRVSMLAFVHGNDYNVSCFSCYNGAINATVSGGVAPFGYQWEDGPTTEDRSSLGAGNYVLTVTDANGCTHQTEHVYLSEPQRDDWTMTGNAGTTPGSQYLGTSDNKDFVFKTNGQERLRLLANGGLKLAGSGSNGGGLLRCGPGDLVFVQPFPHSYSVMPAELDPFWGTCGNYLDATNMTCDPFIGSLDNTSLVFKTNAVERMRITPNGRVAIGTTGAGLDTKLAIQQGAWADWLTFRRTDGSVWRFHNTQNEDRLDIYFTPSGGSPVPGLGLWNNGKVSIGDVSTVTPDHDYRLYVQGGLLTERVKVALKTSTEWSDHVFQPGYRLMPLPEVKAFIAECGHLPGVPSADQMVEQGLDVVRTDAMLLEKVEELMLYVIAMEERLVKLEQENARLRTVVGAKR